VAQFEASWRKSRGIKWQVASHTCWNANDKGERLGSYSFCVLSDYCLPNRVPHIPVPGIILTDCSALLTKMKHYLSLFNYSQGRRLNARVFLPARDFALFLASIIYAVDLGRL